MHSYTSITILEVVCLDMCVVGRNIGSMRIIVRPDTPSYTRVYRHKLKSHLTGATASCVPALNVRTVRWGNFQALLADKGKRWHSKLNWLPTGLRRLLGARDRSRVAVGPCRIQSVPRLPFRPSLNRFSYCKIWRTALESLCLVQGLTSLLKAFDGRSR